MAERAGSLYYSSAFDAQVTKYYGVAVCAFYMADYFETFADEVEHMWKGSRWNLARFFFFFSRYTPIAQIPLLLCLFTPALQAKACYGMHVAVLVMTWVGEAFPIVILLLCLYALYGSKRRHAPAFWGSYFVYMGVQLATLVVYIVHTRLPPLAVRGTNCYTTNTSFGDRFMMANRILRLSLHVVMFLLAAWKGARRYRRLKSPLIKTVLGGEMAYYGGVFAMAALDVVARYYSPNDPARLKILTYISRFGAPVLANRLLVNMYKTAHHGGAGSAHSLSGLRFAGDSTVSLTEVNTDYY
ncbi:hypothetical protein CC2G_006540 [Coprinopsis cinerea AmutBmut pab1-1]|nr:hypothetical protein CC2G_006540 [Coprinopsis cinerea AmutBmut pab1-1]